MMFAALAFTSCVDDNDDVGMPYLEVTPQVLKFDTDGKAIGASEFVIKTNRPWTLVIPDDAQWVRASATSGNGDGKVSFNLFASSVGQSAELTFALKNSAGFAYMTQPVTIEQGDVVESVDIFNETFGTKSVANPWPTVDTYDDWNTTGEGAADVTFAGVNTSIRNSGKSSAGAYDGASGPNVLFFGAAPATFTVQNIALTSSQTNLRLQFGGQFYDGTSNSFPADKLLVSLSADGTNFVPLQYTVNNGDQEDPYWVLATKDFTLKNAVSSLYIRFTAEVGSAYRLDDIRLMTGNGGDMIDLGDVSLTVTTKQPEGVTATDATLSALVSTTEGVTAVGFQYTASSASIDWSGVAKTPADAVAASFTKTVTGLTTGTTYAVRAYATTAEGDTFGNVVTFTPTAGPSGDEIVTDFTLESIWPADFPASSANKLMGPADYVFSGVTYTLAGGSSDGGFYRGKEYQGTRYYLMIGKNGAYIDLPAMADKALSSVKCFVPGAASANVMVGVSTLDGVDVGGGAAIKWEYQDGGSSSVIKDRTYTYNLTGTQPGTKYRLYVTAEAGKSYNAQIYSLTLKYGDGGGSVETPTLTPSTASMEFPAEADAVGKTQEYTIANATGLTLYADVADKTNFSAAVENTNTVRVKTLNANEGEAPRTTTVTVYLSDSPTGEKKATATINVKQAGKSAGGIATTIPELVAKIIPEKTAKVLDANNDYTFEGVVMNDVAGGNYSFNNLILATEGATAQHNGVTLFGSQVEPSTLNLDKGDKVKVTLLKGLAKIQNYQGLFEITGDKDVTWCNVEKLTGTATITPVVITAAQLADYQGMAVKINSATTTNAGVWANAENLSSHTLTTANGNMTVFVKKGATAFLDKPYAATTGAIMGLASVNREVSQLVPRNMEDVAAFNPTVPTITDLNPDVLNWASTEVGAKTIAVGGSDIDGKLSYALSGGASSKFTASISGTTVTVTPVGENTTDGDFEETLTITAAGGNSMIATLKQAKPSTGTSLIVTADLTTLDKFPAGFPESSATGFVGEKDIAFNGYEYTVYAPDKGYAIKGKGGEYGLFYGKTGAYIAFPAIPEYKLVKVELTEGIGVGGKIEIAIADAEGQAVSNESTTEGGNSKAEHAFDLTGSAVNTSYRLVMKTTGKNMQVAGWKLTYEK